VATAVLLELQAAATGAVVPSEKVPVALKVVVPPTATVAVVGETAMAVRVGAVTVTVVESVMVPCAAVRVAVPVARPVTRPLALAEATEGVPEVQVTELVTSLLPPSEYDPVAVSCRVEDLARLKLVGLTWMEVSVARGEVVTLRLTLPEAMWVPELVMLEKVAVMVAVPAATPVTVPAPATEAMAVALEVQEAGPDWSVTWPSDQVTLAVSFRVEPATTEGEAGVMARLTG
jgi:hypothetical protein